MDLMKLVLISSLSLVLSACGGGGSGSSSGASTGNKSYSGKITSAVISETSKETIGQSSIEISKALAVDVSSMDYVPFAAEVNSNSASKEQAKKVLNIVKNILEPSNLPIAASEIEYGTCGGKAEASGSESNFTVIFTNFCETEYNSDTGYISVTLNGKVTGNVSDSKDSFSFYGLSISFGSENVTFTGNMTTLYYSDRDVYKDDIVISSSDGTVAWMSETVCYYSGGCSYSEYFTGNNGVTYRADDYSVYENDNGWQLSGKVYDPSLGSFDLDATNIQYCEDGSGKIESGMIFATDSQDNELSIVFIDCDTYALTFSGVSTAHAQ